MAVRSMMTVTYLSPRRVVPPDVLVDADHPHPVEAGGVVDQDPPAFGQDGVVGGVPRDPESLSDPSDREVLADDRRQRPAQGPASELGPRLRGLASVLAPDVSAAGAPVPADRDQQRGGAPPEGLMCETAGDSVTRRSLTTATPAPPVGLNSPARKHGAVGLETLSGDLQTELVESAECGQVRTGECSVQHVEVLQGGSVRTPILGGPRPPPRLRRAKDPYTLICEEPVKGRRGHDPANHQIGRVMTCSGSWRGSDSDMWPTPGPVILSGSRSRSGNDN